MVGNGAFKVARFNRLTIELSTVKSSSMSHSSCGVTYIYGSTNV